MKYWTRYLIENSRVQSSKSYTTVSDFDSHYRLDQSQLDSCLRKSFVQLRIDSDTCDFINNTATAGVFLLILKYILSMCFSSVTNVLGWLNRGEMHVLSYKQVKTVLGTGRRGTLLDIGAGCGSVTDRLSTSFTTVYATEVASIMVEKLKKKGYMFVLHQFYLYLFLLIIYYNIYGVWWLIAMMLSITFIWL